MPKKRVNARNKASIKVVGVGGGGGNAISRMKDNFIRGVEFIAINTDTQDLDYCDAHKKLYIGKTITRGLGTGMNPELGRQAAEENRSEIAEALRGADLVFITAGLGGGTGSGASVTVAEVAREVGALTVAVVTKPFSFEGGQRAKIANEALVKLKEKVDTYIVVPNDKIFAIISRETSINKAFEAIDNVLRGAVQGIAELIALPGIINVDFADVKTVMEASGSALVGIGIASGKDRGVNAVKQVLNFPLLEVAIDGARSILFGISGGRDLKMAEINDIARAIVETADPAAKIIFGAYHDRKVRQGAIKVTLIATSFEAEPRFSNNVQEQRPPISLFNGPSRLGEAGPPVEEKALPSANGKALKEEKEEEEKPAKNKNTGEKKKSSEIWDIPTFLRRKKKE